MRENLLEPLVTMTSDLAQKLCWIYSQEAKYTPGLFPDVGDYYWKFQEFSNHA